MFLINYIWIFMICFSLACSFVNNSTAQTISACLDACESCLKLILTISATMCFWKGMLNIAADCGVTKFISKILRPITRFIIKPPPSPELDLCISSNITANLLGLGNASTPFGISAMKLFDKHLKNSSASNAMCRFIVLNTASVQLIPSTVFALRSASGSKDVFCVLVPIWIVSLMTLIFALALCSIFEKTGKVN